MFSFLVHLTFTCSSFEQNLCISLASTILDSHANTEVYFIVDAEWQTRLAKADSRFKFGVIEYDTSDSQNRIMDLIQKFEKYLELSLIDRTVETWKVFLGDMSILEIDRKSGKFAVNRKTIGWFDGALLMREIKQSN